MRMRDDGLIAFIAARLDDDEAAALAAAGQYWEYRDSWVWASSFEVADVFGIPDTDETGTHIARHDPARVLREVAVKRAMLAELTRWPFDYRHDCDDPTRLFARLLGAAWSDHPDYRQEWQPDPLSRRTS